MTLLKMKVKITDFLRVPIQANSKNICIQRKENFYRPLPESISKVEANIKSPDRVVEKCDSRSTDQKNAYFIADPTQEKRVMFQYGVNCAKFMERTII